MRQKEQGKKEYVSPTKNKSFLNPTFSNICCKDSNYHIWGNSKYRKVCQVTNLLILATNIIWAKSKYHNMCKFTKLLFLAIDKIWRNSTQPNRYNSNIAIMHRRLSSQKNGGNSSREISVSELSNSKNGGSSSHNSTVSKLIDFVNRGSSSRNLTVSRMVDFVSGGSSSRKSAVSIISNFKYSLVHGGRSNYSLALQDISNLITVLYNIQWSSRNYGTSQEKETKSKI